MMSSQVPLFGDKLLRMPADEREARGAYERFWSGQQLDRPYLYTDVVLDSGLYVRHVEFDGSGIAMRFGMTTRVMDHPELFGRRVVRWCPVRSLSNGKRYEWATEPERLRFARAEGQVVAIRGMPLPPALAALIEAGKWVHPGEGVLRETIPFVKEPVDLLSIDSMEFESSGHGADTPHFSAFLHELRGSSSVSVPDLPWRDVSRSFFIAVNRNLGDDLGIALDFRQGPESDPRVIASDWGDGPCQWRHVSDSLSELLRRWGM